MRQSYKKFLSVCFLLMLVIGTSAAFTGCHGSKGMNAFVVPEEFDTSKEYEITFWAKNDTNNTQVMTYEKAISDFEALYPNVKVNLRLYTDYGRLYNDVITNIATNTTPNVCITYPDHIATYMTGVNQVVPLDELFVDEKFGFKGSEVKFDGPSKDEIIPKFLEECIIDGKYYAVPYMRSTEACYVNVTYLEALGYELPEVLTWDFVWEVSEAAMAQDAEGNFLVNGTLVNPEYNLKHCKSCQNMPYRVTVDVAEKESVDFVITPERCNNKCHKECKNYHNEKALFGEGHLPEVCT